MLYIGRAGVGLGYLRRPALTAAHFVTRELPGIGPRRLYRTGERARFGPDGVIELLGRDDSQLKIHGLRVEPGEIESVLRRHPAIRDAVVVRHGTGAQAGLAACCVPARGEDDLTAAGIRDWLAERLPRGLVPRRFAFVAALPLTSRCPGRTRKNCCRCATPWCAVRTRCR